MYCHAVNYLYLYNIMFRTLSIHTFASQYLIPITCIYLSIWQTVLSIFYCVNTFLLTSCFKEQYLSTETWITYYNVALNSILIDTIRYLLRFFEVMYIRIINKLYKTVFAHTSVSFNIHPVVTIVM